MCAVASPSSRADSVKSSAAVAARSATRQASSTPGRNRWAKTRWPRTRSPDVGSAHSPATEPTVCGTCVEPASVSADWTTTSGFSPGWRERNTLAMTGFVGSPSASTTWHTTEVLDCSPRRTAEDARPDDLGVDRVSGDGGVGGVALRLGLRLGLALDERQQLGDEDLVVGPVVDPARAEDAVLRRPDERILRPGQRRAAVGEGHLVDHRLRAGVVGDDHDLDADLARGVVEAEPAQLAQHRSPALRRIPALPRQPGRQQLELRRRERRVMDLSHADHPPRRLRLPLRCGPSRP